MTRDSAGRRRGARSRGHLHRAGPCRMRIGRERRSWSGPGGRRPTPDGISRARLAYQIERGDVPGPSLQVPRRRLFSEDDVGRIRRALAERQAVHVGHPGPRRATRVSG
jgi:hypothetical protein